MKPKNNLEKILEEAAKNSTVLVMNPKTIEELKEKGVLLEQKFISYEVYFEQLIKRKQEKAIELLKQLPHLDSSIASGVVTSIYEEIRASLGLEIMTSVIYNSIMLLEFAMREKVYEGRLKHDPNSTWEDVEKLKMRDLIQQLLKLKIINETERLTLEDFNNNFRNPYLHMNIHKMTKDIYLDGLKRVDINTQEIIVENGVKVTDNPHLWFAAKKFFDSTQVFSVLNFCINWTNKLLAKK